MNRYDVIIRPIVTEKGVDKKESERTLCFEVHRDANKTEIKQAVESLFKVKVKAVNTIVRKGKLKTFRGRRAPQGDTKRAVVTLVEGHTIDLTTGL